MSDDFFDQQTSARLAGVSVQAFQRWGLEPDKRAGRKALYKWSRVRERAEQARERRKVAQPESGAGLDFGDNDPVFRGNFFRSILETTALTLGAELSIWLPDFLDKLAAESPVAAKIKAALPAGGVPWENFQTILRGLIQDRVRVWLVQERWVSVIGLKRGADLDDLCEQVFKHVVDMRRGPPDEAEFQERLKRLLDGVKIG